MSFLYKTTPVLCIATFRPQSRLFSKIIVHRSVVKDAAKTVDRTVSDQLVKGIDKGVEVKDKAAASIGVETGKAEGAAQQAAGEAKGKAAELKGKAKGTAEEIKAKM